MHYTLHQLQIFRTIVKTSSITKTAEIMHLTQPAVSIQLKKFQDQFDIPLTEIIGRQIYITEFGQEVSEAAERILNESEKIKYTADAYKGKLVGRIKTSIVSTAKYVMPYVFADFLENNPAISFSMDVTNKEKVVNSLIENEVDFSMMSVLPNYPPLESISLMPNSLYLVVGKRFINHKINLAALESLPWIFREQGSATRQAMEMFLRNNNITVHKQFTLTSNEAIKQAVIAGLGVSIMPLIGLKSELENEMLQIKPVLGLPIRTDWRLVWLKAKKLSPVAKTYLEQLKENQKQLIDKHFSWVNHYEERSLPLNGR